MPKTKTACPEEARHTPCPRDYLAWHEWAERKSKTHRQVRCPGCNRFEIWLPVNPITRYLQCERCHIYIDQEEYMVNFGVCESCFEEGCPCTENCSESCPLHSWPDVVFSR